MDLIEKITDLIITHDITDCDSSEDADYVRDTILGLETCEMIMLRDLIEDYADADLIEALNQWIYAPFDDCE